MPSKRPSFRLTAAKLLNRIAEDGLDFRRAHDCNWANVILTKKEITILKTAANILIDKSRQEKALRKQVRELKAQVTKCSGNYGEVEEFTAIQERLTHDMHRMLEERGRRNGSMPSLCRQAQSRPVCPLHRRVMRQLPGRQEWGMRILQRARNHWRAILHVLQAT